MKDLQEKKIRQVLSRIFVLLGTYTLSILLTVLTVSGIVQLALKNTPNLDAFSKPQRISLLQLPVEAAKAKKRDRKKPKPVEPPETKPVLSKPLDREVVKPDFLKPALFTGFKPTLGAVGSFRVGHGSFAATGPARGLIPVFQAPPQYPYQARRRGLEGMVELEFTITKDGSVRDISVVRSKPPHVFDRAAIAAIARWRFKPKEVGGTQVEQRAIQQIQFQLGGKR